MSPDHLATAFERVYFLVVRLDEFSSALTTGLKAADVNVAHARSQVETGSVSGLAELVTNLTPPARTPRAHGTPAPDERLDYPKELLQSDCYVVRIRKRVAESPSSLVTVGRAAQHDIPLQHPSVSKLHAWFEFDENLYVHDAGSTNRTFVNGDPIEARTQLRSGDSVKFGAVRCAVCSAVGLWRALNSTP